MHALDAYLDRMLGDRHHPLSPDAPEITDAEAAATDRAIARLPGHILLDVLQNHRDLVVRAELDAWLVPLLRDALARRRIDLDQCYEALVEHVEGRNG